MAWREQLQIGELTVEKPLKFASYTLATVPDATDPKWFGATIYISDATPPNLATSDGTIWAAADDGLAAA